ncbi:MAG: hypothetical protein ACTSQB_05430, partial [Candidatus Heimdallarchaeota archaeon]
KLEKAEAEFKTLETNLNDRRKDEIDFENQKKGLLTDIESLQEQINRIGVSTKDEDDKIAILESEISQLTKKLVDTQDELRSTEALLANVKEKTVAKEQERAEVSGRMDNKLAEAQKEITILENERTNDSKVSPILDFLLKEVRIDIPEVEILSVLAYRNQAMGLDELKKAVSKTPPVIILKVIRNLDSKGIVKYDERLDTIEIIANMV